MRALLRTAGAGGGGGAVAEGLEPGAPPQQRKSSLCQGLTVGSVGELDTSVCPRAKLERYEGSRV